MGIKIVLEQDKVEDILLGYVNHTLHIKANALEVGAGTFIASYDPALELVQRRKWWWQRTAPAGAQSLKDMEDFDARR